MHRFHTRKNASLATLAHDVAKQARRQERLYALAREAANDRQAVQEDRWKRDRLWDHYSDLANIACHLHRLAGLEVPDEISFFSEG